MELQMYGHDGPMEHVLGSRNGKVKSPYWWGVIISGVKEVEKEKGHLYYIRGVLRGGSSTVYWKTNLWTSERLICPYGVGPLSDGYIFGNATICIILYSSYGALWCVGNSCHVRHFSSSHCANFWYTCKHQWSVCIILCWSVYIIFVGYPP